MIAGCFAAALADGAGDAADAATDADAAESEGAGCAATGAV